VDILELAMEISLVSLGSSHTFLLPHLSTLAVSRFCGVCDTIATIVSIAAVVSIAAAVSIAAKYIQILSYLLMNNAGYAAIIGCNNESGARRF
jgi:hypothetical protein